MRLRRFGEARSRGQSAAVQVPRRSGASLSLRTLGDSDAFSDNEH
jgi:hypothetical protein